VERPPHDRPRLSRQAGGRERPVRIHGPERVHPCLEGAVVLLEELPGEGGPRKGVPFRGPDPERDHVAPQAVSEMDSLGVARILAPAGPAGAKRPDNLGLLESEERPHVNMAPSRLRRAKCMDRPRRRKARGPAPSGQAHHHRLRHVVLLVTQPEHADPAPGHFAPDECKAPRAGRTLAPVAAAGGPSARHEGHTKGRANTLAEPGISGGLGSPEPVVKMKNGQSGPPRGPMGPEQEQQRKRVRAAGKGDGPALRLRPFSGPRDDRRVQAVDRYPRGESLGGPRPVDAAVRFHREMPIPPCQAKLRCSLPK